MQCELDLYQRKSFKIYNFWEKFFRSSSAKEYYINQWKLFKWLFADQSEPSARSQVSGRWEGHCGWGEHCTSCSHFPSSHSPETAEFRNKWPPILQLLKLSWNGQTSQKLQWPNSLNCDSIIITQSDVPFTIIGGDGEVVVEGRPRGATKMETKTTSTVREIYLSRILWKRGGGKAH